MPAGWPPARGSGTLIFHLSRTPVAVVRLRERTVAEATEAAAQFMARRASADERERWTYAASEGYPTGSETARRNAHL